MRKTIQLHKKNIDYTLKVSKRAKRMRLAVYCDGSCVVTVPQNIRQDIRQGVIERFILQKSRWLFDKMDYFASLGQTFFVKNTQADYMKYREQARLLAESKVHAFNKIYKFEFNTINIKNQKTCWGSCSKKGNLNFNYRIALLPDKFADYIIVHEIAHLGEFNHSKKFWNLVAKAIPEYRDVQDELKKIGVKYL